MYSFYESDEILFCFFIMEFNHNIKEWSVLIHVK